jgi:imidazole glycerol-phosphate synthase subunit HisH
MTVIVDYGCGNLSSIANMIRKIGGKAVITSDPAEIAAAEKIILPGIGAFDTGMSRLNEMGFAGILNNKALKEKVPVLGICLGMQLMTRGSEEGVLKGLSWFDADTLKFNFESAPQLKVPLMGWKYVQQKKASRLLDGMYETPKFYFVHSYYVRCNNEADILATTMYGSEYTSAFEKDNLFGVQFHPEKSHKYGMKILQNFIGL